MQAAERRGGGGRERTRDVRRRRLLLYIDVFATRASGLSARANRGDCRRQKFERGSPSARRPPVRAHHVRPASSSVDAQDSAICAHVCVHQRRTGDTAACVPFFLLDPSRRSSHALTRADAAGSKGALYARNKRAIFGKGEEVRGVLPSRRRPALSHHPFCRAHRKQRGHEALLQFAAHYRMS